MQPYATTTAERVIAARAECERKIKAYEDMHRDCTRLTSVQVAWVRREFEELEVVK